MNGRIGLWIDHGPSSGMGHLSRCRGLIEFLSQKKDYRIEVYGADNISELPKGWTSPSNCYFSNLDLGNALKIPAIIVDTYNGDIQRQFYERNHGKTALISDSNSELVIGSTNLLQIKLEVLGIDAKKDKVDKSLKLNLIEGSLFWSSKLEGIFSQRSSLDLKNCGQRKKILVSFGGSTMTLALLEKLLDSLEKTSRIGLADVEVFCNDEIIDKLETKLEVDSRVVIHAFDDNFYEKMKVCDLLICGSGTTALEAYHLAIPCIVIKLFDNAKHNFENLKKVFLNAIFIDSRDVNLESKISASIVSQLNSKPKQTPTKNGVVDSRLLEEIFKFLTN
jgi:spore coat polysaccharide biosynthesis predicted glycosyltransferase SpsG